MRKANKLTEKSNFGVLVDAGQTQTSKNSIDIACKHTNVWNDWAVFSGLMVLLGQKNEHIASYSLFMYQDKDKTNAQCVEKEPIL